MNEIGEILKEARIEKGYTLDDLQQITKIQKRYLEAIEDGNTEILPGRFYARAFVKQYADIVGLNGEELLEEHESMTAQEASEEFADSVNVPPTRTQVKRGGLLDDISEHLPTILIFLLVAAILIVIYMAFRQMNVADDGDTPIINEQDQTEIVSPPNQDQEADTDNEQEDADGVADADTADDADDNETEDEEEPADEQEISILSSSGSATTYEITGTRPEEQTVELTASGGDSWVSINVQGGPSEAALLSSGQSLSVSFGPEVTQVDLVIGNASVTEVSLNEMELQYAPEAAGIVKQDLQLQFTE